MTITRPKSNEKTIKQLSRKHSNNNDSDNEVYKFTRELYEY